MKILLLINEKSGTVQTIGAEEITRAASAKAKEHGAVLSDIVRGDFSLLQETAQNARDYDSVLCAGGDGTQAAVAGALAHARAALLPLPCGTVNMFCRDLNIPLNIHQALDSVLSGHPKEIDIGMAGDRFFLNNIVFGAYAKLAEAREEIRDAESFEDYGEGFLNAADAILNANPIRFHTSVDDQELVKKTNTLCISNNAITHARELVPRCRSLSEGKLYLYISEAQHGGDFLSILSDFTTGTNDQSAKIDIHACDKCTVSSKSGSYSYSIDGDPIESDSPVEMEIMPKVLRVLSPQHPE